MTNRFTLTVKTSNGSFSADFADVANINTMIDGIASGAQVAQGWDIYIKDRETGAHLAGGGLSIHGMKSAVAAMLDTLSMHMPRPARDPRAGMDVVVPVRLAVHDGQLVDAEDFVRGAVEKALTAHSDDGVEAALDGRFSPQFSYNGDTVTPGSAKEDRS